jgi:hypothetical protein
LLTFRDEQPAQRQLGRRTRASKTCNLQHPPLKKAFLFLFFVRIFAAPTHARACTMSSKKDKRVKKQPEQELRSLPIPVVRQSGRPTSRGPRTGELAARSR